MRSTPARWRPPGPRESLPTPETKDSPSPIRPPYNGHSPALGRGGLPMKELPEPFQKRGRDHPKVHQAYEALAAVAHESGPLDERTRRLVKLAIAVGARLGGAGRAPTWQDKDVGVSEGGVDHGVL